MTVDEVDTPALLVDLDAFDTNLRRMAQEMQHVRVRPHAKTHKCAIIGLQQMALGAVGMCCQKVSEAEALVYGGVSDVLVTNEVVGRPKLQRLAAMKSPQKFAHGEERSGQPDKRNADGAGCEPVQSAFIEVRILVRLVRPRGCSGRGSVVGESPKPFRAQATGERVH